MKHSVVDRHDGHGPQYGCGWTKCGNPNAVKACPFTKDGALSPPQPIAGLKAQCKHFWQQHFESTGYVTINDGLFCAYCLETRPDVRMS